jgi:type I site-specific restriction endonuclease
MANSPADYVLFAWIIPIAAVEAKRKNTDVSASLQQAKRYAGDLPQPTRCSHWVVRGRNIGCRLSFLQMGGLIWASGNRQRNLVYQSMAIIAIMTIMAIMTT